MSPGTQSKNKKAGNGFRAVKSIEDTRKHCVAQRNLNSNTFSSAKQGDAQEIALGEWKSQEKASIGLQGRLKVPRSLCETLQRNILLSQKQRAFSKAVVLVAPEKRLPVVVLLRSAHLESLERCELQIISPRVSELPVLRIKRSRQIEASNSEPRRQRFSHAKFECRANQTFFGSTMSSNIHLNAEITMFKAVYARAKLQRLHQVQSENSVFQSLHIALCSSDSDLLAGSFLPHRARRHVLQHTLPSARSPGLSPHSFPPLLGVVGHACKRGPKINLCKISHCCYRRDFHRHFDVPRDEASLCTRFLLQKKFFSDPTFRAALPKKKSANLQKSETRNQTSRFQTLIFRV